MNLGVAIASELAFSVIKRKRFTVKKREVGMNNWIDVWDDDWEEFVYEDKPSERYDPYWSNLDSYDTAHRVVDLMNQDYLDYIQVIFTYAKVKIKLS